MKLGFIISDSVFGDVVMHPDYSGLKFMVTNNDGKAVFTVSGAIKLFGIDYDQYKQVGTNYEIQCYQKGSLFFSAPIENIETDNENVSLKHIDLTLKAETEYLQPGWSNYEKEYNINELEPETNSLYFEPGFIPIAYPDPISITYTGTITFTLPNVAQFARAGWDIDLIITQYSGPFVGHYDVVTVYYHRQQAYGYYIGSTLYDPDGVTPAGATWQYLEDLVLDDRTLPLFKKVITPIYTPDSPVQPYGEINNTADYFNKPPITYNGITRKVTDVIEFLLDKMGVSSFATIDSSGTATDSFYSFLIMTGQNMRKSHGTTDKLYANLLVCNLTDFVPANDDTQKDVPASETWVSFKTIIEFFERRGFYWYLQNRTGTYYFILEHKSLKTFGTTNPDLRNYYNMNFEKYAEKYDKEPVEFKRIINKNIGNSIDFIGTDLNFYKINTTDALNEFSDPLVYVDLNDIANRKHDVYPEFENNNIVIIASQRYITYDYVRDADGKRTLSPCNNSELSWSFISELYYCGLQDADIRVNGANLTAADYRLKRKNKYKVTIPINDILSDFDLTDYLVLFGQNNEIESISQDAKNTVGDIIFKS